MKLLSSPFIAFRLWLRTWILRWTRKQKILVPAYFDPINNGGSWALMLKGIRTVQIAVMNPDTPKNTHYAPYLNGTALHVVGYVNTNYTHIPIAAVKHAIDDLYGWYSGIDGIFVDNVTNGSEADADTHIAYYTDLYAYIGKQSKHLVVLNPGSKTSLAYAPNQALGGDTPTGFSDILVSFEGSFLDYVANYQPDTWEMSYPNSVFCHLVYETFSSADMEKPIDLSRNRKAGFIYVSDGLLKNADCTWANTWVHLPPYWLQEVDKVKS